MKLNIIIIVILGFSILFVTSQAYAPCIEGPGINCNNYPPQALSQIKSDKLNYETLDKPVITIVGVPSTLVHLEIDDSSSNIVFTHDINLSLNGTAQYVLDISSYKPGVYSVIGTSPISKLTTSFAVGLVPTGGKMTLNVDKNMYFSGDHVLVNGTGDPNTLIQMSLVDLNGTSIRSIKIFSDKTGHFSLSDFTIPNNAVSGIWQIGATSGVMHVRTQITVNSTLDTRFVIKAYEEIMSPLKQFKSGIAVSDIKCKEGLQFIMKNENGQPACVTPHTFDELITRGWGIIPLGGLPTHHDTSIFDTGTHPFSINVVNTNFTLNYNISGNNKLLDANMDSPTKSLVLSMCASSNGTLSVSIPRALLDSKSAYSNQDTKFIILINKQEVKYIETTSLTARTLTMPFELGAKKIEIIAPANI